MECMVFSDERVEFLPLAKKGRYSVKDNGCPGLYLRISPRKKVFYMVRRSEGGRGKPVWLCIGSAPPWTVKKARNYVERMNPRLRDGENPNDTARQERSVHTLSQALEEYLLFKRLKPRTESTYKMLIEKYLADWLNRRINEITMDDVVRRHNSIANGKRARRLTRDDAGTDKRREATADNVMRTLRAILSFYEDEVPVNQVSKGLSGKRKLWYKVERRQRLIRASDLPRWYKAVIALDNPTQRDFLLLILYTGLRRNEAASLRWVDIDFEERTLFVKDTKAKRPLTIPLSRPLYDLLKKRHEGPREDSLFIFPGTGKSGYLQEPKWAIRQVVEETGIEFSCHDLRRTYTTIAESLDISPYAVKALLNHSLSLPKSDVTAGYVILNVDRLRDPAERIAKMIRDLVQGKGRRELQPREGRVLRRARMIDTEDRPARRRSGARGSRIE